MTGSFMSDETREEMTGLIKTVNNTRIKNQIVLLWEQAIGDAFFLYCAEMGDEDD